MEFGSERHVGLGTAVLPGNGRNGGRPLGRLPACAAAVGVPGLPRAGRHQPLHRSILGWAQKAHSEGAQCCADAALTLTALSRTNHPGDATRPALACGTGAWPCTGLDERHS